MVTHYGRVDVSRILTLPSRRLTRQLRPASLDASTHAASASSRATTAVASPSRALVRRRAGYCNDCGMAVRAVIRGRAAEQRNLTRTHIVARTRRLISFGISEASTDASSVRDSPCLYGTVAEQSAIITMRVPL